MENPLVCWEIRLSAGNGNCVARCSYSLALNGLDVCLLLQVWWRCVCVCLQVKCDQYWPNRGTETYGLIQVTLLDTVELATYCVRTFALYKVCGCFRDCSPKTEIFHLCCERFYSSIQNGSSEKREVRQFQFTAWPDHGVPEHPTPFLAFLRRVKSCNPPDAGPMVVHCRSEEISFIVFTLLFYLYLYY